jgi:hypothetical protein
LSTQARATEIEIGTDLICDTQQQVERFVTLFDGNAERAINTVNAEANDLNACIVATIAYMPGPEVATARTEVGTFHVLKVLVLGILTEAGFQYVRPAVFFSVTKVDEQSA